MIWAPKWSNLGAWRGNGTWACVCQSENDAVWGGISSGGACCARASPTFADIPEASRWPSHAPRKSITAHPIQSRHSRLLSSSVAPRFPHSQRHTPLPSYHRRAVTLKMITDSQLYSLAIFLGSAAMLLIVLYHFLEVNSDDHKVEEKPKAAAGKVKA
ncbi:hypothetical protein ACET3X_009913 [Alternaria dauci]